MKNITRQRFDIAVESRRAIKYFEASYEIPEMDLEKIILTATNIPTPNSCSPFKVFCLKDKNMRKKLKEIGFQQPQHTDASIVLVICMDKSVLAGAMDIDLKEEEARVREHAMLLSTMFSQGIMVAASSMGYDSCPMIGFMFDRLAELISKPDHLILTHNVALGKRLKGPLPRGSKRDFDHVVHIDKIV